ETDLELELYRVRLDVILADTVQAHMLVKPLFFWVSQPARFQCQHPCAHESFSGYPSLPDPFASFFNCCEDLKIECSRPKQGPKNSKDRSNEYIQQPLVELAAMMTSPIAAQELQVVPSGLSLLARRL
ncbi:MAG: hypothetical protein P8Y94_04585, partial [Acidobacteriota bacterium]